MRAGRLRHRVELQENTPTVDARGDPVPDWSTYATVWAAVEPLSGAELVRFQQVQAETTCRVVMRYNADVSADDKILHDSRTLQVLSVINRDDRNIELELLCKEVA